MRRRLEAFERRLAALAGVLRSWSRDAEREEKKRQLDRTMAAFLRAGLERAGLDPNESPCLRDLENPPAWRQPRPFVHPLRRLAERQRPRTLLEALHDMTRRYQDGRAPNLRQASVMQLIGYYCFGDGNPDHAAREAPA